MTRTPFSILGFHLESRYQDKEYNECFDYYGKLFIRGHEPFQFIGTIALTADKNVFIKSRTELTNRFYEVIKGEGQKRYIESIEEEAKSTVQLFL